MFAKIRLVTISFIISVHLSIRLSTWDNLVPTRWILNKFVLRTAETVIVWLKSDKYIRHFTWHTMYVYDNILLGSSRKRNSFRKKVQRKSKHLFHIINIFFSENRATYVISTKKKWHREAIDDRTQYGAEKYIPFEYGVIKAKIYCVIIFNTCCVRNVVCKSEKLHLTKCWGYKWW